MDMYKILEKCLYVNGDVILFATKNEYLELVDLLIENYGCNVNIYRERISILNCNILCVTNNTWRDRLCGIMISGVFISSKYSSLYPMPNDEISWLKTRCRGKYSFSLEII